MVNSLTVFLAFVGFLAFGYLSLVRLLAKKHLHKNDRTTGSIRAVIGAKLVRNLGSSAFFVSLPATAILLFWGWAPAIIWLVIFHFFIDSVFQLQFSSLKQHQKNPKSIADYMLRSDRGIRALIEQGLIQAFFLLSMAVVVALVATLIDRQPGLLFALVFLIPARQLISHPSTTIATPIKAGGALALLAIGLVFSDQLGFSVYGDWAPFERLLPWLVFNMPTLIAGFIVLAVFQLETNQGFKKDLSLLAGTIIVVLVIAMMVKLVYLRPILDAPVNTGSADNSSLPAIASLSLFVFAGFSAILIRLLNEEENADTDQHAAFGRLQCGSAIHSIYMGLLVISLGAALGIGAWKTHFLSWSESTNMLDYLNLSISSNLNLIYADADSGTLLHTVLLAALCFTGFSFLLMCANQLSLEEAEKESLFSLFVEAKLPQALGIFILSAFFISSGISVNTWLITGILAWVLFIHLALGMTLSGNRGKIFAFSTLALLVFGVLQISWISIAWMQQSAYFALLGTLIIVICATFIWLSDIRGVAKNLSRKEKVDIF